MITTPKALPNPVHPRALGELNARRALGLPGAAVRANQLVRQGMPASQAVRTATGDGR